MTCEACGGKIDDKDVEWRCDCVPGGPQCCSNKRPIVIECPHCHEKDREAME